MGCSGCKKKKKVQLPELTPKEKELAMAKKNVDKRSKEGINTKKLKEAYTLLHKHGKRTPDEDETLNKNFTDTFGEKWTHSTTQVRKLSHYVENILGFKI